MASSTLCIHLLTLLAIMGRFDAAEYVPVHPEADGSVRHALTVLMSVLRVVHVLLAHLPANT